MATATFTVTLLGPAKGCAYLNSVARVLQRAIADTDRSEANLACPENMTGKTAVASS